MVLFLFSSCQESKPLSGYDWLAGNWVMETPDGNTHEDWEKIDDSTFKGVSYSIAPGGEKKMLEEVQLIYRQGLKFYIPSTLGSGQPNQVTFTILREDGSGFTAENPTHDFPKRIHYFYNGKDSLHAWIDGGREAASERMDFYFVRRER